MAAATPARASHPPDVHPRGVRNELPWVLLVLAGSLAPLLTLLATGHTLAWRDTSRLFAPMRTLISDAFRQGHLPLWNPHEALGMPLFAQLLHGVLHPWSVLAAFLTRGDGMDLLIVLHVATGAVGAGVLARALGGGRSAAAVSGLAYGLSGYLLGTSAVVQYLAAGGTAPWAVAGLCWAARGGAARIGLGAAGTAALHFAGDPQWALVAAALGMLLAWTTHGRSGLARSALAVAGGTALAAVQLVPAWGLLQASGRGEGLAAEDRVQWAFAPARILELVVPGLFAGRPGAGSDPVYGWLGGGSRYPLPFLPSVFVGVPVLTLAAAGVRSGRVGRAVGAAALILVWLSLGHFAGATQALAWMPVWSGFRYAEKLIGPFTLCAAALAALGVEPLRRALHRSQRPLLIGAVVALLLGVLAGALLQLPPRPPVPAQAWAPLWTRLGAGLLLGAGALAALGLLGRRARPETRDAPPPSARWIVAMVLATGLAGSGGALHTGARDSRDRAPLAELHGAASVPRIVTPVTNMGVPIRPGIDDFDALQAVQSRSGVAPYAVAGRVDNFTTYTGLPPRRFDRLVAAFDSLGDARWASFRRYAVTHVVLTPPITARDRSAAEAAVSGGEQIHADRSWNVFVWEVPHAPWARFAESVLSVSGEDEAIRTLVRLETLGSATTTLEAERPAALSPGRVLSIERHPARLRVEAESEGDGLLVVADAFWPGWHATIDGQPVDIEIADALVRAVRWPAGRHVLEMRYRPTEVRIGAIVSLLAALILVGAVVRERSSE